jgi:hypothetical protein
MSKRAITSTTPPGANGTTTRTDLFGYCAAADVGEATIATAHRRDIRAKFKIMTNRCLLRTGALSSIDPVKPAPAEAHTGCNIIGTSDYNVSHLVVAVKGKRDNRLASSTSSAKVKIYFLFVLLSLMCFSQHDYAVSPERVERAKSARRL